MKAQFSNDATAKYLGYVYQVWVAVETILDAAPTKTIWIESFGDVSDGETSIEVKHHQDPGPMSKNSPDLWKTLRNWIEQPTDEYSKLVFVTTEKTPRDLTLASWDSKSNSDRLTFILQQNSTASNAEFHMVVTKLENRSKLEKILEKTILRFSEEDIESKITRLLTAKQLAAIPKKHKRQAILQIYVYVNEKATVKNSSWQIDVGQFNVDLEVVLAPFRSERIPFPEVPEPEEYVSSHDFPFVKELNEVSLPQSETSSLVRKYIQTMQSTQLLVAIEPVTMERAIREFDNSMKEIAESRKADIDATDPPIHEPDKRTHKLVRSVRQIRPPEIRNVQDTQVYYGMGRLNHLVNESRFSWLFQRDDGV